MGVLYVLCFGADDVGNLNQKTNQLENRIKNSVRTMLGFSKEQRYSIKKKKESRLRN